MGDWKECKLQKVAHIQTGPFGSQLKNEQYITGGTPVVTVEHINNFRIIDFEYPSVSDVDKNRLSKYLLRPGDIIFTRVGSVDLSALVRSHQNGWMFSSRMLRVRPSKEISSKFLSYFFQQNRFREYIINIAVGATMPSINTEILKDLPIAFPPLPKQKAIASVLSSLDDKIDLLHRQNKTLESLAETLFRQWFVEEALDDWETGVIGDFVNIAYGKNLPTKKLQDEGYPVFGGNGVIGFFEKYLYEEPQVLVSCRGEASGVVNISFPKSFVTNNSLVLERNKRREISFEFLKYFALNEDFKVYVSGSAQPQITINGLYDAEFTLPDKEKIDRFSDVVKTWEFKRTNNQTQIRTLEKLRNTLLPKLMNGEVRVEYEH